MSGGGSGGGSSGVKYDNLERLYGTQQQAAGFMLDQAMPRIPGILDSSQRMVTEAMDGSLGARARSQAYTDSVEATHTANNDALRNLTAYGAIGDPSGGKFQELANKNAISSAATRAGAMGRASQWAEDQKWNRNAGLYGQVSGMSTGAMQGMSSAGSGLSNLANQQNQNDMANAKGFGQFGSAVGSAMTKADGGYIRAPGLAAGGDAWQAYKAANPSASGGLSRRGGGRGQAFAQMLGGAAPHLLGAGLKDLMKGDKSKLISGAKDWYTKLSGPQQISMQGAPEYANAQLVAPDMTGFEAGSDIAAGLGSGVDAASGVGAGADAIAASYGAQSLVSSAPAATDAVATAIPAAQAIEVVPLADGGYVQKRGLRFALGGGVRSPIAKSGVDDMDASMAMPRFSQMDDKAVSLPAQAQQAAVDTRYMGKTDGMGETSAGDPDGFGKEGPDNRHMAGKATMSIIGRWLGGPWGGMAGSALAEVVHPVGEAVSRGVITTGDKLGGSGGALVLDPIGTTFSGKYSNEELAKGHLSVAAGMPWLSKFLADGGDVEPQRRADYTPGGKVTGPGTETSDDIPAWLSDGEYVLNKPAVDAIGRSNLDKANKLGLKVRAGKIPPGEAKKVAIQGLKKKGAKRAKAKQRTA